MVFILVFSIVNGCYTQFKFLVIYIILTFLIFITEVSYKDPSGIIITVHNLQVSLFDIHSKPPEAAVARRLLNESVATGTNTNIETTTIKSGKNIKFSMTNRILHFVQLKTGYVL